MAWLQDCPSLHVQARGWRQEGWGTGCREAGGREVGGREAKRLEVGGREAGRTEAGRGGQRGGEAAGQAPTLRRPASFLSPAHGLPVRLC